MASSDLDGDEDLDILTVEENVDGKGIELVAYENVMPPVARYDVVSTFVGAPAVSVHVSANDTDETFRDQICDFDGLCGQAQITIRALPEPGLAVLLTSAISGLAALARPRRAGAAPSPVPDGR